MLPRSPAIVADIIPILAVADGRISYVGQHTVDLRPATGAISRFRHLQMLQRPIVETDNAAAIGRPIDDIQRLLEAL